MENFLLKHFRLRITPAIILFLVVFSFSARTALCQSAGTKRVVGTFIFNKQVYSYEFTKENSESYNLIISSFLSKKVKDTTDVDAPGKDTLSIEAGTVEDTITDTSKADSLDYVFSEFDKESFSGVFIAQMNDKFEIDTVKAVEKRKLEEKANQLFFSIAARLEFLDDEPVTANLILKKDEIVSVLKGNGSSYYTGRLSQILVRHRIHRASIETDDGAIKNIIVQVIEPGAINSSRHSPRKYVEFKNQYPISISGKHDPDKFAHVNLYSFNCNGIKGLTRYIKLSDVLMMDIVLENDKDDYSPANRVVTLSPSAPIVELKKEKRARIIEVAAFSDFSGLDQEQPNGLIQFEAKRKINLLTKYYPFFKNDDGKDIAAKYDLNKYKIKYYGTIQRKREKQYNYAVIKKAQAAELDSADISLLKRKAAYLDSVIIKKRDFSAVHFNLLGSLEPRLLFSKLEENNRYLLLDSSNRTGTEIRALNIYQHQLASFGTNLSVFRCIFPQAKVNWNVIDAGLYWYRTRVKERADSASIHSNALNNMYWSLGSSVRFRPDSRWGAGMGLNWIKQKIFHPDYSMDHKAGLLQVAFDGHLKTNDESRLFFRFRWTFDGDDFDQNFTQIQLGYSINIFASKNGGSGK